MSLLSRWKRFALSRREQKQQYHKTKEQGHIRRARWLGRRMRKLRARMKRRKRQRTEELKLGPPGWGGSKRIMRNEVWPIVRPTGIQPTSGKRRETFGNPSSDHFFLNLYSFAKDYATKNNIDLATKIRRELTGNSSATHQDYEGFFIERFGWIYRIQIIAKTHGTGPHLHVGIRRIRRA